MERESIMKTFLCSFALLANVVLCQAAPINFASLVGDIVSLTVEPYASGQDNGSFYVGLTEGIINGDAADPVWMFCNDAQNQITVPITYDVTVVSLLNSAFAGDPGLGLTLTQLQQQATLGLKFGSTPSGNLQAEIDAQQDIWNYTGGTYSNDRGMLADTSTMEAAYQTNDYSGSYLLNVTGEPGQQAFMPVASSATPEPVSVVLLGLGLLMFGLYGRRRNMI
jgi:hypothetical protein